MGPDGPDAEDPDDDPEDFPDRVRFGRGFRRGFPRPGRRLKINTLSFNRIFPNILTLLALCAGLTAIRYAMTDRYADAVMAVIVAAILDGVDGRVARLLRATSKFGQELDSLADGISFGVCPAIVMYLWTMHTATSLGWPLCLLFAVCVVLRLARFNTMAADTDVPLWAHNYFTGVPSPAGAGLALMPMILWLGTESDVFRSPFLVGFVLLGVSVLMVSRIPTFAGKHIRLKTSWVLPLLIVIGVTTAFLVSNPWATLSVIGFIYLASIPISAMTFRQLKDAHTAVNPPPAAATE